MSQLEELRQSVIEAARIYSKEAYKRKVYKAGQSTIPPSGKVVGEEELVMLVDSSMDLWLTTGRYNDLFEKKLAEFIKVNHLLTTNSGSSADLLAFAALTSHKLGDRAIKAGDEVITVAAGFPTTVNPILLYGAVPVFLDIDIPTYNIDVSQLKEALTQKTKAIMIAHTLGNTFNLDEVVSFAKENNLWLIEDCCDALGTTYHGKHVGTFGDIGTVSFYPAHHITMGEGGAVFTNNNELIKIVKSIRDWGRDCYCDSGSDNTCNKRFSQQLGELPYGYDHKYTYSHLGYNLKITDMQAAVALAQLGRLPGFIEKRKENFKYLIRKLEHLKPYLILPVATENSDPSWFGFPITLTDECPVARVDILRYLDQHRIGTRLLFAGNLIKQPYFEDRKYRVIGELDNTNNAMEKTFWVGIYPGLDIKALDFVAEKITSFLEPKF